MNSTDPRDLISWATTIRDRTLIVAFPTPYRVLSWAPLHGGFTEARTILNHQVQTEAYPAHEPGVFLHSLAQQLNVHAPVVGLMTGVKLERLVRRVSQYDAILIECFATVGLSNALAVGDPATYEEQPGTINLILVVNQPIADAALVEAVAVITEAKVRALYAATVKSTISDALATGTGTDCVAVACPLGAPAYAYCGKHTRLGELFGQAVSEAVAKGIRRAQEAQPL